MDDNRPHRCCWNCPALVCGGSRFVEDFSCRHPEVKKAMEAKGVDHLDKDKLGNECPLFVTDIKAINRRAKQDNSQQLSLL